MGKRSRKVLEEDNVLTLGLENGNADDDGDDYILNLPKVVEDDDFGHKYAHKVEGDDVDDGEGADREEEEAAMEVDKANRSKLQDADFAIPGLDGVAEVKKAKGKTKAKKGAAVQSLITTASLKDVEQVEKDFKAATDEEKLKLLSKDSPELLQLLEDYRKNMHIVKNILAPVIQKLKRGELPTSAGMSFLQMKFHIFLLYCMHIVFYMLLKVEGKAVKDHPVIQRLVELRVYIQKIVPLEKKLKYNIERLLASCSLKDTGLGEGAEADEAVMKPRLDKLIPVKQVAQMDEGEAGEEQIYAAPRDVKSLEDPVAKAKKEKRSAEKLKKDIDEWENKNYKPFEPSKAQKKLLKNLEKKAQKGEISDVVQKEESFEGGVEDEDMSLLQFLEKKRRTIENAKAEEEKSLIVRSRALLRKGSLPGMDEDVSSGESDDGDEDDGGEDDDRDDGDESEDEFYKQERLKAEAKKEREAEKKRERKRQKLEEADEEDDGDETARRAAGKKIVQNRGLVPSRKKLIPRVHTKKRHQKQLHRRKSQVKDYQGSQYNTYSGEKRIADHVLRGTKLD